MARGHQHSVRCRHYVDPSVDTLHSVHKYDSASTPHTICWPGGEEHNSAIINNSETDSHVYELNLIVCLYSYPFYHSTFRNNKHSTAELPHLNKQD